MIWRKPERRPLVHLKPGPIIRILDVFIILNAYTGKTFHFQKKHIQDMHLTKARVKYLIN